MGGFQHPLKAIIERNLSARNTEIPLTQRNEYFSRLSETDVELLIDSYKKGALEVLIKKVLLPNLADRVIEMYDSELDKPEDVAKANRQQGFTKGLEWVAQLGEMLKEHKEMMKDLQSSGK